MNLKQDFLVKKINILLLLAIIVAQVCTFSVTNIALQDQSTSTSLIGSVLGGTKLYIEGVDFSTSMGDMSVTVGGLPCHIEDAATDNSILCVTSPTGMYKDSINLPISVSMVGKGSVTATQRFSYNISATPHLTSVYPSVSYGGSQTKLYWNGVHRIKDLGEDKMLGDIYAMNIGDSICSRFGIYQSEITWPNSPNTIQCFQPTRQKAGKYNLSEHLFPGYSWSEPLSYKFSETNELYQFVVLPLVNSTTNTGSIAGQEMKIEGTGFSTDPSQIDVKVDGVNCKISESNLNQIRCRLDQKKTQPSTIIPTNHANPQNQHISGTGFFYKRYDISKASSKSATGFKATLDSGDLSKLTLQDEHISGQIATANVLGSNYGEVWKGYFIPTVSGKHKFRGVADDGFAVYLETATHGSTVALDSTKLIAGSQSATPPQDFFNFELTDRTGAESAEITLTAGQAYYMQVYHVNQFGVGSFSLAVQMPPLNPPVKRWQTHEVHTITTNSEEDPEIIQFNSVDATSGTITLSYSQVNEDSGKTTVNEATTFPWDATADVFCVELKKITWYKNYDATCTLSMKTFGGASTTDITKAADFTWRVTIPKNRGTVFPKRLFKASYSDKIGQFTEKTIQPHSDPISGTFTLSIGGVQIRMKDDDGVRKISGIPANVASQTLRDAIRQQVVGMDDIEVERIGDFGVSGKWIIYYFGYNGDVTLPSVVNAGLIGGGKGIKPTIVAISRRQYSTNSFVNPIDYRWMKTYSNKPNVLVTVKGIPSVCNADCSYEFKTDTAIPKLTSLSLTGFTVTIGLTDPTDLASLANPFSRFRITIDQRPCHNLNGLLSSFTCTLDKNADGTTPILRTGIHYPDIYIQDLGYAITDPRIDGIVVPLVITPSEMYVSSLNGGHQVVIAGSGFPLDKSQITFILCGKVCPINRISNIEAAIVVPPCSQDIGIKTLTAVYSYTIGSISILTDFEYTAFDSSVSITSITPTSASPVLKGIMKITGTGFGTDETLLQVWMSNSTGNIYRMKVIKATDTQISAGISGGLPGQFDINVIKQGFGYAVTSTGTQNDFKYEVKVASVSPVSGSFYGGTLITIDGVNFVDDAIQTMVTIGDQLNQLCRIEQITATQIKCRTPPKHVGDLVDTKLEVEVMSQLIIPTNCSASDQCWFQYSTEASSPRLQVVPPQPTDLNTVVTLTGTKFDMGEVSVAFYNRVTGKVTVVNPEGTNTATSIQVKYPVLEAGKYSVKVRVGAFGQTNGKDLTYHLTISSPATIGVSTEGAEISLLGAGFPDTWPNKHYSNISFLIGTKNYPVQVISTKADKFTFMVPKGAHGTNYKLTITSFYDNTLAKTIDLEQRSENTPSVNLVSASTIAPNALSTILLQRTSLPAVEPQKVIIYSVTNPSQTLTSASFTYDNLNIAFDVSLKKGKYAFKVFDDVYGWYTVTANSLLAVTDSGTLDFDPTIASFNGGLFKVTGNYIGKGSIIKVQGLVGNYVSGTDTQAYFSIPKLVTPATKSLFSVSQSKIIDLNTKTVQSDSAGFAAAFDNNYYTAYSSSAASCNIIIDMGSNKGVQVTKIRYFPTTQWSVVSTKLKGAEFMGSNDKLAWTTIETVDSTVHTGWNTIMTKSSQPLYRYIKFSHTQLSGCKLAELEISGIEMSTFTIASTTSFVTNVEFDDGAYTQTFENAIEYREDKTAVITNVEPAIGHIHGDYTLTLTGNYLDIGTPIVKIDGVQCKNPSQTLTGITCTVQQRKQRIPKTTSFTVEYDGIPAIIEKSFKYVLRWSDPTTWGTDLPPIAGDLVYVPQGMHLLVDQSTPVLKGIVVENATLEFADEADMTIEAGFITLRGGQFIAGTKDEPHQHKLTFIMHGDYYGVQQPMLGNKGIGCVECKLQMHGQKRLPTWTLIAATISPGDTTFTVMEDVDWKAGETIVVASTSYDHNEAEERVITSVTGKRTITVDRKFIYKHYSGEEMHGTDKLVMRAEVALLTRNILMMGDDNSVAKDYGSHLMVAGKASNGAIGQIAYVEFTKCGQPQIVGRYCHHFHLTGDSPDSYSIGNSVHHSMARILTIHGTHYLYVAWNVGYRVKGHNFFLEDGIETNNVIEYNLAISSLLVNNMMQTDMSVASFWITNPTNIVRHNHAAGSDFYGFWYQIKEHPDGPSATKDICPIGNPMGESRDNVAHSNVRFGLRIFHYYARENPCEPIRNDSLQDPWSANPSIESKFENYVLWKNGESGLLAEFTGDVVFENFIIAESKLAGMQFYKTNFTKKPTIARNIAIIGRSSQNPPVSDEQLRGTFGAIMPRTGHMTVENIRFYDFLETSTIWESCSKCDNVLLYTNLGAVYKASAISYTNIQGKYFHMKGLEREIFYDLDGTLTNGANFNSRTITSGALVKGYPHLLQDPACQAASTPSNWDDAAVCNQDVKLQHVMFTNINDEEVFRNQPIKARMIANIEQKTDPETTIFTSAYSLHSNKEPMKQKRYAYSLPYIQNRIYNIWWGKGLDFKTIMMRTSPYFPEDEPGVLFKFNYTATRELFDVTPIRQDAKTLDSTLMKTEKAAVFTPAQMTTCLNGDYFHDNTKNIRYLTVCSSAQNRTHSEYLNITSVPCRFKCPAPPGECTKQLFRRKWNNATQWPGEVMPLVDTNVTIPCEWTVDLDMNPQRIDVLMVEGTLNIPDTQEFTIEAKNIWIVNGLIKAGDKTTPHTNKLTFQLNGLKNDAGILVSPVLAGNKLFVNTGRLELFGNPPTTVWTKMTAFADKGANQITVESTTGWVVGDHLVIAPSFMGQTEFEKVTITNINDKTVTFTPVLQFDHFGDTVPTVVRSFGTLDTRTGVGHLTRNIKIQSGPDNAWGFSLVQFSFLRRVIDVDNEIDTEVITTGKMTLSGVQFIRGGQFDTMEAGLQIINVKTKAENTLIEKSSFHECQDLCMRVQNSQLVEINNNVFFRARRFHIRALSITKFTFTNNLMIGVIPRPDSIWIELRACVAAYDHINTKTAAIRVHDNLCQGSQGHGFAVPHVDCADMEDYPFQNNTIGSSEFGWIFSRGIGRCLSAKGCYAYSTQVGNIHDPSNGFMMKFKNFIFADSTRAMTIRLGGDIPQKTAFLYNSYVTAISRPTCTKCYGPTTNRCVGNHGMRMLTTGLNSQELPFKFGYVYDVVCKAQTIDGKVFVYDTEFNLFRQEYTSIGLTQCSNNVIFKPHPIGTSLVASHHLFKTNCTNCQLEAFAYFSPPPISDLGWFGGCGDILCTGFNNYIIEDHTGDFLPQNKTGTLLPNNSWIGDKQAGCQFVPQINGHLCSERRDFAILQYESIAPDFNTRIMWPAYLKYDGGNWTSVTNGWREWEWDGLEPLNKRLGRFVSTVKLFEMYNLTFAAEPPTDMTFQLQQKIPEGDPNNWVIIKMYYPRPNAVKVEVGGKTITPILIKDSGTDPLDVKVCGSNKFFYKNYTIHFVVTGDINCQVRVTLTDSIQLTAKFDMKVSDFLTDIGVTKFINRMCALLGITDVSRMKMVGIFEGSTIGVLTVSPPELSPTATPAQIAAAQASFNTLKETVDEIVTSPAMDQVVKDLELGPLLSIQATVIAQNPQRCATTELIDGVDICRSCNFGYHLSDVYVNEVRQTRCLLIENQYIEHCKHIKYDTVNKVYQCLDCNEKYDLIDVIINSFTYKKCLLKTDAVTGCVSYILEEDSCSFLCGVCNSDLTLSSVKKKPFEKIIYRTRRQCLITDVQSLPHCELYTKHNNIYYCRPNHCAEGATEIKIGPLEVQKACTKFTVPPVSQCAYFERPKSIDVALQCGVNTPNAP